MVSIAKPRVRTKKCILRGIPVMDGVARQHPSGATTGCNSRLSSIGSSLSSRSCTPKIKMIDDGDRPRRSKSRSSREPTGGRSARAADRSRPGYDRLPQPRRFEYVPLWGIAGVVSLRDAAGELPDLRRQGGASSLGRRQVPFDDELPLVPGPLGQAAVVEGSGRRVSHDLGQRVSCR